MGDADMQALKATIERTGVSLAVVEQDGRVGLLFSIRDPRSCPEPKWFLVTGSGNTHKEAAKDLSRRLEELCCG